MNRLNKKILSLIITIFIILNIAFAYKIFAVTTTDIDEENQTVTTTTANANGDIATTTAAIGDDIVGNENVSVVWDRLNTREIVNHGHTFDGSITLEMLYQHGDLMCSQRGTRLPDSSHPAFDSIEYGTISGSTYDPSEIPEAFYTRASYTTSERKYATPEEAFILAFAQCSEGSIYGEKTPEQIAWWHTPAGQGIASSDPNFTDISERGFGTDLAQSQLEGDPNLQGDIFDTALSTTVDEEFDPDKDYTDLNDAAKEFQKYILEAAKVKNVSDVKRISKEDAKNVFKDETLEEFFYLDYDPEWIKTDKYYDDVRDRNLDFSNYNLDNPTIKFTEATPNGDNILVGYYAINYVYEPTFAFITKMELETNDPTHPVLVYGDDFTISSENLDQNGYPLPCTPFQFAIKHKYNATRITNVHVEFEYTNAKGSFNYFYGQYKNTVVNSTREVEHYTETDPVTGEEVDRTRYRYDWEEVTGPLPSQRNAGNIEAEIRRFRKVLDRRYDAAQIIIEKTIVDEKGDKLNIDNPGFFDFILEVNGSQQDGRSLIRVRGNSAALSQVYTWEIPEADSEEAKGDSYIPTFNIREIPRSGYKTVSVSPSSGKLRSGTILPVTVIAENQLDPKTGTLSIEKIVKDEDGNIIKEFGENIPEFTFKVTIDGKFKYQNGEYKNQSVSFERTVKAGTTLDVLADGEIKWYEREAPTFHVEEINVPDGYKEISVDPSSGSLKAGENVKVTAVNDQLKEKGKVQIIKTLEHAESLSKEDLEKLSFEFELSVDGYASENIVLNNTNMEQIKNDDGTITYRWVGNSVVEYEWNKGENPSYTLKETKCPAGTQFSFEKTKEANKGNESITVEGNVIKGVLTPNTSTGVIENYVVNTVTPKTGHLKLIKKISDKYLEDKEFKFVVKVTGTFYYKDQLFKDQTIQLTNDGYVEVANQEEHNNEQFVVLKVSENQKEVTWESDEFTWYGKTAPTYTVEENLIDSDIESNVSPSKGSLSDVSDGDNNYLITVTATNGYDKIGYLHIIKTLDNADKCPVDYVKDLVFKFKINVDGFTEQIVSLTAELKDNKWVWEYTGSYTWKPEDSAPKYTIEEVELPEGTTFVSANGQSTNKVEGTLTENSVKEEKIVYTENTFVNRVNEHEGYLVIEKKVTDDSLIGKEFKFNVTLTGTFSYGSDQVNNSSYTIKDVVVKGGESVTLGPIKWFGDSNDGPSYTVEEQESDIAKVDSIVNGSGTIKEGSADQKVNVVTVTNAPKKVGGYLQVTKQVEGNISTDEVFRFKITIGDSSYYVELKANETYKSDYIEWNASDPAPKYKVEEIELPDGFTLVEIKNAEGSLKAGEIVEVVAINRAEEKHGKFKVTKQIVPNKFIDAAEPQVFEVEIKISGTFEINGEMHYASDGDYIYTEKLSVDVSKSTTATYISPDIKWWGNNAPTVTVEEINLPKGWRQVGAPSNNGAALSENDEIELVISNELPVYVEIDLTIELAGQVWEDVRQDAGKNMPDSVPNGKIDGSESGIKGVEVYVYRTVMSGNSELTQYRTLAKAYSDNLDTELTFPVLTDMQGEWKTPRLEILSMTDEEKAAGASSIRYDVEFVYDGQTYEPTIFLSKLQGDKYVEGNAGDYINASTSERDSYADKSMAKDYDREIVNNRIQSIYGNTPIDGEGQTVGAVQGSEGENAVRYVADVSGDFATRVQSKVVTTDANGVAYSLFKAKARTSVGGLQYPFDNKMHLEDYDVNITDFGLQQKYKYSATYNYCLHINLGLVRRKDADAEATKDLYSAKVLIDGKELDYTFNKLSDLGKDTLNRHLEIDNMNISYELGLYKTDYYYRAEMYKANTELYSAVDTFYKTIGRSITDSELEVYLTYKLNLYNTSSNYVIMINSVNDYSDTSLGEPINGPVTKLVNGEMKEVANKSYMKVNDQVTNVDWATTERNIHASDGKEYIKTTANLNGLRLESGQMAEIYVTYAVQKEDINEVTDAIILGNKSNMVEIANYSTYYSDGTTVAGKIDIDSAPANVNIKDYNEKPWAEDDTDMAPTLKLELTDETRKVNGIAWEDKSIDENAVGNGLRDDDEALIGGLTTELIEKVTVDGIDYDFLWPTSSALNCLGGKTLEYLTGGFASTTETSRISSDTSNVGEYRFTGVPTGKYVVRFLYGNDKTELEDQTKVTLSPAEALKADGTSYYDDIKTANYDGDNIGYTPAVYNGQDYKSTIYQVEGNDKNSDARDSEARRLEVIAASQTITNLNGTELSTANDVSAKHTELYNKYSMFADTAKIDLAIESADETGLEGLNSTTVKGKVVSNGSVVVEKESKAYELRNIDFGLIERPENAIILDKEIGEIRLVTNDNNVIFDAIYDINYAPKSKSEINDDSIVVAKINDNQYLVAEVTLNTEKSIGLDQLQALDKNENKLLDSENKGTQNFRFINVDETILQGTTIEINYVITALNVGEKDYTSKQLAEIENVAIANNTTVKQEIRNLANEMKQAEATGTVEYGKYLGNAYYTGTPGDNDVIVTTKVRQIVDYADNDSVFTSNINTENNHIWRNTTITELSGSGFEESRLIDPNVIPAFSKTDKKGIEYVVKQKYEETEPVVQRNNLLLSVDDQTPNTDDATKSNADFEKNLVPYTFDSNNYSSQIVLTLTKTVSAQDDADNLSYDNITEIVKFENSVGRRDEAALVGNANPIIGEFKAALQERDSSATELVTFTPPTGNDVVDTILPQVLATVIAGLAILTTGVVIIKKRVLTK